MKDHGKREKAEKPSRMTRQDVAQQLRERIIAGKYVAGGRLPTCEQMAEMVGASYVTVLRGLDMLRDEGFIVSQRGSGTFVTDHPPHLFECALIIPKAGEDAQDRDSRFWRMLCAEARKVNRKFAPWRVRPWYCADSDIAPHKFRVPAARLEALESGAVAGVIIPFHADGLRGTPLLEAPNIARVSVSPSKLPGLSRVGLDHQALLGKALGAARASGCRRVSILASFGLFDEIPREKRESYVRAQVRDYGLDMRPYWLLPVDPHNLDMVKPSVHMMMDRPAKDRPDALILLDDHYTPAATAGILDAGVKVPADLQVIGYCNFPDRPESTLPMRRIGFDIHTLFEECLAAIDRQRREGVTTNKVIQPVFEEELESSNEREAR